MKKVTSSTNRKIPIEIYVKLVSGVMSFLYGQGNKKADGSEGLWNTKIKELPTRVYFIKQAIRDYEKTDEYKKIIKDWGHKLIFKTDKRWFQIIDEYYSIATLGPANEKFSIRALNKNIKENRKEFHKYLKDWKSGGPKPTRTNKDIVTKIK